MSVQSWTVRRMTLSTRRSSSDQLRRASCLVSFSERGWFLMRKKRSKLRSHISSSNSSRVLPAATTASIHSRNWPRRKSGRAPLSAAGSSSAEASDIDADYSARPIPSHPVAAARADVLQPEAAAPHHGYGQPLARPRAPRDRGRARDQGRERVPRPLLPPERGVGGD